MRDAPTEPSGPGDWTGRMLPTRRCTPHRFDPGIQTRADIYGSITGDRYSDVALSRKFNPDSQRHGNNLALPQSYSRLLMIEPTPKASDSTPRIGSKLPDPPLKSSNGADAGGAFHALRFRNFRLYFFGQLVSVAGSWMQGVAQQWLVFSLTHSAAWLGIVSGASAVPYVLLAVVGGHTADRHPRRKIMIWTQTAAMILAFLLAALATNRWIHIQAWHIAVIAGLAGIINAFNMPAQQAFVPQLVDDRAALGSAIALNSLMFNLGRFLGPIAAGVALVKAGPPACFALNGISFLAVIASLLKIDVEERVWTGERQPVWEGFYYVRNNPIVFRVVSLVGAASLFAWSTATLFPIFAARFHTGERGFTGLMASQGVGAALGGLAAAALADRFARRTLVYTAAGMLSVFLFLFSLAPTYWLSLVFLGLMPVGGFEIGLLAEVVGPVSAVRINVLVFLALTAALFQWSNRERGRARSEAS